MRVNIYMLCSLLDVSGVSSARESYLCLTKKALFVFNLMHLNHLDHYFTSWQKSKALVLRNPADKLIRHFKILFTKKIYFLRRHCNRRK